MIFWFTLFSCTEPPPKPKISQHKNIVLDGNWTLQAWRSQRVLPKIDTRFSPDQNTKDLEQGTLVLKNIWWKGFFEQGQRNEEFDVGRFDATISEISLQESFLIHIETPAQNSAFSGGSLRSTDKDLLFKAQWISPPEIHTHPTTYIQKSKFAYKNGTIQGQVLINTSIDGQLNITLFSEQDIIATKKIAITSQQNNIDLKIPLQDRFLWSFENPRQLTIQMELIDNNKRTLDVYHVQTGFRDVAYSNGTFFINNIPYKNLRAARLEIEDDWVLRLQEILQSGIQAIEIHGEMIPDGLLEWADRVGMGIVIVPRCIGRTPKLTSSEDPQIIFEQDLRLVDMIQHHPSVLFLVAEGEDVQAGLVSDAFQNNGYLVGGRDFPSGRLRMDVKNPKNSICLPHPDCSMWITEITLFNHPPKIDWNDVVRNQQEWTKHSIGFVLPAERRFPKEWAEAYQMGEHRIVEIPQREEYEGTPNMLMWLHSEEGVVFDHTGRFERFR